jgi:hypothetical protein
MSDLPDVCTELQGDAVVLIANKAARKVLNAGFAKPRPRWNAIAKGVTCFKSPEYRALRLEGDGIREALAAMLWTAHKAGLHTMFMCAKCSELHVVDDEQAAHMFVVAMERVENALPAHETIQ